MLSLDANEHMGIGKLVRTCRSLGLISTVKTIASNTHPTSHVNGSKQIDSTWTYSDLSISAYSFCPRHFSVGDHRVMMVAFDKRTS